MSAESDSVDNSMSDVSVRSLFGRVTNAPIIYSGETNDRDPPIVDVNTPDLSFEESEPLNESRVETSVCGSNESQSSQNDISSNNILKDIRVKNVNRLIIGTLKQIECCKLHIVAAIKVLS